MLATYWSMPSPAPPPTSLLRLQGHGVTNKPHIVHLQLELGAAEIFGHGEQVGQGLVRQPVELALLDVAVLHVLPLVNTSHVIRILASDWTRRSILGSVCPMKYDLERELREYRDNYLKI